MSEGNGRMSTLKKAGGIIMGTLHEDQYKLFIKSQSVLLK
jgi:hypothetical protein